MAKRTQESVVDAVAALARHPRHSISQWLGHNHLNTTARYLRMATPGYSAGADALSLLSQLRTPPSPPEPRSVAKRRKPATAKAAAGTPAG